MENKLLFSRFPAHHVHEKGTNLERKRRGQKYHWLSSPCVLRLRSKKLRSIEAAKSMF